MMINQAGIDLIKKYEGFRKDAYKCPAGIWTIGYGSTMLTDPNTHAKHPVRPGQTITEAGAVEQLKLDVASFENVVLRAVTVKLTENQRAALTAFCYNVGPAAFKSSTLVKQLNAGHYNEVRGQLMRWTKGGGRVLTGLVTRRDAEADLFEKP